jgi:hypothetical protein
MTVRTRRLIAGAAFLLVLLGVPRAAYAGYCTGIVNCFTNYWWLFLLALVALVALLALAAWAAEAAAFAAAEGADAIELGEALEAGDVEAVERALFGTGGVAWTPGVGPAAAAAGAAGIGAAGIAAGAAAVSGGEAPAEPVPPEPVPGDPLPPDPFPPEPLPPNPLPPEPQPPVPQPPRPDPPGPDTPGQPTPVDPEPEPPTRTTPPEGFTPKDWERFQARREPDRYPTGSAERNAAQERYRVGFTPPPGTFDRFGEDLGRVSRSADGNTLTVTRARRMPDGQISQPTTATYSVDDIGDQGLAPGETAPWAWTNWGDD